MARGEVVIVRGRMSGGVRVMRDSEDTSWSSAHHGQCQPWTNGNSYQFRLGSLDWTGSHQFLINNNFRVIFSVLTSVLFVFL